jgi:hypothetical protein
MKKQSLFFIVLFCSFFTLVKGQNITFSEIEKNNSKNSSLEVIGKIAGNILVYKNIFSKHKLTVFNNDMTTKELVDLDYISDRTTNIDFIPSQNSFLMLWQFQKKNIIYCNAVKLDGNGKKIGEVQTMDSTKVGAFSNNVYYNVTWSEDKKRVLIYKYSKRSDDFYLATKVIDENLVRLDSARYTLDIHKYKESVGDLQVDNNGGIVFTKLKENNSEDYISEVTVFYKKSKNDSLFTVIVPLEDTKIKEPVIKLDNVNNDIYLNSFSYRKSNATINGLYSAVINKASLLVTKKAKNVFSDTLLTLLSGKPDWRTVFDNFFFKNTILKKDGGYILVTEEYYKERRFNNANQRFNSYGYDNRLSSNYSDYYSFNRGNYGYYRPYDDNNARDMVFNYDDILIFSFTKDLKLEWNTVINKRSSDIETDNYLSFTNMVTGGEIYFLFFQKENRQILSNHALKPNGTITRYPTLKSREAGYEFMPKLGRQTGSQQIIIPCTIRGNIAFAKIDF